MSRTILSVLSILMLISIECMGKDMSAEEDAHNEKLRYPELVADFLKQKPSFWTGTAPKSVLLRKAFLDILDSANYKGLDKTSYHIPALQIFIKRPYNINDTVAAQYFSDALISYCKDLVQAPPRGSWVQHDDVSAKHQKTLNEKLSSDLLSINSIDDLYNVISSLEPATDVYQRLISELTAQIDTSKANNIKKLEISLSYYRWIYSLQLEKCIVVNIPSAMLNYYEHNEKKLTMKVVVGKSSTKTPRFAAHCNEIILYPYWHVPRSIAVKEILPACKKNASVLNVLNLQVLNSKGMPIDPHAINWKAYNSNNFTYTFRQSTGCDNALGVIKFNLTDPFSVYLHDTNFKSAFNSNRRYLSHGCIRVEKPIELANSILATPIDTSFIKACIKGQRPVPLGVQAVPVFTTYMPAEVTDSGVVVYHNDVYGLL